jgi:GAF domain-containing protein
METGTKPAISLNGALLDMVVESEDAEQFLSGLTRLAADTLSSQSNGEVLCAVTLLRQRSNATVASSSERAARMDEVQYVFDDGPCLRAAREGRTVHVKNMLVDDRFPEYRDAVAGQGILSALGVPIPLNGGAKAGLNFYSTKAYAFDDDAVAAAETFAREASSSLRLAIRMAHLSDTSKHLEAALESRTEIDLAIGIIMGQNRCSQDEAIKILKSASNARNIKLRDIAAGIVNSTGQGPVTTHFDA